MQAKAFTAAVRSLGGATLAAGEDPVTSHFETALRSLDGVDLMTASGNQNGTLAERVAFAQQAKEKEFQQTFMVTADEAAEVRSIASQAANGDGFDFEKLSDESLRRLNVLYTSINNKVGYALPASNLEPIRAAGDSAAEEYIAGVNSQLASTTKQLDNARLAAFVKAFV